jgi:hypothetical protein
MALSLCISFPGQFFVHGTRQSAKTRKGVDAQPARRPVRVVGWCLRKSESPAAATMGVHRYGQGLVRVVADTGAADSHGLGEAVAHVLRCNQKSMTCRFITGYYPSPEFVADTTADEIGSRIHIMEQPEYARAVMDTDEKIPLVMIGMRKSELDEKMVEPLG